MNIYQYAVENKLRFQYKGQVCVEDLWDLSVNALDRIYGTLMAQKERGQGHSLLTETHQNRELEIKITIVKDIVEQKLNAAHKREEAAEKARKKAQLLDILEQKKNNALHELSPEEIEQMIANL